MSDPMKETIDQLASLHESNEWAITQECAEMAKRELDHIRASGEPEPKILVENPDAVSFTWDIRGVKIYRCLDVEDEPYTQVIHGGKTLNRYEHHATHVIMELTRRVYRGIKDDSPDDDVVKLGQITAHIADLFPEAAAEVERLYPRSKVE